LAIAGSSAKTHTVAKSEAPKTRKNQNTKTHNHNHTIMKKELKFKTNIKCMGCVSAVTPALNETVGAGNWEVDIQSPNKPLTIQGEEVEANAVIAALEKVGYKADFWIEGHTD